MIQWGRDKNWKRAAYLAVAAAALVNGGCLVVAAGVAAGGAAGYMYCKGKVCQLYVANMNDTWAATHTALKELGLPVENEEQGGNSASLQSRTADGDTIRISLATEESRVPAEGPLTRVCVRVATFGDYSVSERVLYQVSAHLTTAATPGSPAPPSPVQGTPAAPAPETGPPPLLQAPAQKP